jgi:hypothetical protein
LQGCLWKMSGQICQKWNACDAPTKMELVEDSSKVWVIPVGSLMAICMSPCVFCAQWSGHGPWGLQKIDDFLDLVFEHVQDLGGGIQ